MTHISRAVRRPLALTTAAVLIALVAVGGSALAAAAPKSSHRSRGTQTTIMPLRDKSKNRSSPRAGHRMSITSVPWGTVGGHAVALYTLRSSNRMIVKITSYGGVIQSIWVPSRNGGLTNVALGFPALSDYVNDFTQGSTGTPWPLPGGSGDTYFGAIVGRYANRIANASFSLNGTTYKLDANNGTNTLHGGYLGWNTNVWTASTSTAGNAVSLHLTTDFPAGEGCLPSLSPSCTGFSAPVATTVTYTLTSDNQLKIHYRAVNQSSSLATVINLTNHTYFNLAGEGSGTVYDQLLALNSDKYTPVNTNLIPEPPYFVRVAGTPFDFRSLHPIGQYIRDANLPDGTSGPFRQLQITHGYDHNWVLNGTGSYRLAAIAEDPGNGVTLRAYTDQPGVQVYTGNFLVGDLRGTGGKVYRQGDAFTLETQHYPDAPHHIGEPGWPSVVVNPGGTFTSTTAFKFDVAGKAPARRRAFR